MADADLLLAGNVSATRRVASVEVVVPVFNEEADLEGSVRRLHSYLSDRFPLSWVITVADNASTDHTWGIACRLATELDGVQALHLDRQGRGLALRTAWAASEAKVVAYTDVDLSTDLDALLPLVAPLLSGHSDVAIGSRLAHGSRIVRGPRREVISRGYNLLLRTTLRAGFSDAQCGFKAVRADVARALLPLVEADSWFFDTELLVLAERNGFRIHEVPVDWVDDPDSRVDVVRTARDDLNGIWRLLGSLRRGQGQVAEVSLRPLLVDADHDLAGQLVRFASIGVVSTVLFGVLFAVLASAVGPWVGAVVAMAACGVANTAANRRLTFALRGPVDRARQYAAGAGLALLPMATTLATLGALTLAGVTALGIQLVALTTANASATLGRFLLLRTWAFRPSGTLSTVLRAKLPQLLRYGAVSVVATITSLTVLTSLVATGTIPAGWANVVACMAGTVPSFELNRRWVWNKSGRRSIGGEVVPFALMSLAGLVLSTVAVSLTAHWAAGAGLSDGAEAILVAVANLAAWGSLWVAQFVILDRVLFRHHDPAVAAVLDPEPVGSTSGPAA